jgi:hypothetical protein
MPNEFCSILQLSPQTRVDDWYFYWDCIAIQVYGCEFEPYLLPTNIPSKVFVLEYLRQRISFDHLHFISKNQKSSFAFPAQVFSFVVKSRSTLDTLNKMISSFGFKLGNIWKYDPYHIVSKECVSLNSFSYIHHVDPKIEMMDNKDI